MINRLLTITLIISVLLFGSVETWSSSVIQFLVFTLGLAWILKGEYREYQLSLQIKLLLLIMLGFICYGAFQAAPLPSALLKLISPLSFQMQSFYSLDAKSAMPISFNVYGTLYETIRSVAFFTVFTISATGFSNRDKLTETLRTLSIFGFSLAIFAIVQKATSSSGIFWFRELTLGGSPFGPFVNRNHFAGLIGMLIPLGLGLAISQHEKEKKALFGFLTVIMGVSLFFSLSRGGIISFFAGMGLFALLMLLPNRESRKVWIIAFFIVIVIFYVIYLGIDPVIERFYKTEVSSEERLVVWSSTWTAIKDFWLTGSGLGSFLNIFHLYSPLSVQGGIYDHAHNDYLEFFLEAGLIGILFLLGFVSLMIYAVAKQPLQGRDAVLRAAALSSVFTMAVHSFFDFNLHILSNMLVFACVLGMVAGLSSMESDTEMNMVPLTKHKKVGRNPEGKFEGREKESIER
jgi:O-antigen ligase